MKKVFKWMAGKKKINAREKAMHEELFFKKHQIVLKTNEKI